eukprot:TRINITY_DN4006_c0_g1_i1.p1 TRINITY_DN4006_c0_g1~~TRINITY_DN4006_c0_g1_i1.p1  ORF type:complete len:672 (+),score=214.46 TRINITY_DN4006_c0_g1_i1:55-2016(+)
MSIFVDEAAAKAAYEDLRNDKSSTNWVIVGYAEGNTEQVNVLEKGEGEFDALYAKLKDDEVVYATLGLNVIDEGVNHLKYIFITWVGSSVKPLHKARSSQHRVLIYNFANTVLQLSGEYQALTREELTEELLKQKLTGSKVAGESQAGDATVLKSKGAASSETFHFENEEAAKAAVQGVRSNTELKWVVFGYESGKEDVVQILAQGQGGVSTWENKLADNEVIYVLSGVNVDAADYANQIKFILITWVGPNVLPLHKARSSQHRVQIYNYAKQFIQLAGEAQFLNKSEVTEQALQEKLLGARAQESKSEDELRKAAELDAKKKQQAATSAPTKAQEEFKTPLADEGEVKALLEPMSKNASNINWISFGYEKDGKKEPAVVVTNKGTGHLEEVLPLLQDDEVLYVIYGHVAEDAAVEYSTLKYIFITWVGPKVKPLHKARSSQHRVALYNFINKTLSLAGELQILTKEELTLNLLSQKITGSRLEESKGVSTSSTARAPRSPSAPKKEKEQLTIAEEDAAKAALLDVRNSSTPTNWVVFTPTNKPDTLSASASGSNGLDELKAQFKDDGIAFGVFSVTSEDAESGEDYKTVKNIFISWVGPDVKPLLKARSSQLRLGLYNYIKNILTLHGELQVLTLSDLTIQLVHQKFTGSKN